MKTITLYLAVSGTTYFDQLDRFQGWSGTPLTAAGLKTSQALGQQLATVKFDTAFASDTSRGLQTGQAIIDAQTSPVELQQNAALRSPFYGGFEGVERAAVWSGFATKLGYPTVAAFEADQTPTEIQNLLHDHDVDSLAESGDEFWQRYEGGLAQVVAATPDHGRALVIVDAAIIRKCRFEITGQLATEEQVAPSTVTIVDKAGDKLTIR